MNKATRWILAAAVGAAAVVAATAATTDPPNLRRVLAQQRELVAEHPYDPAALNDLGNLLQLAGDPAEAEIAYRRALEAAPDMISARYNLALLLQRSGRLREALAEYHAVLERRPSHAWSHYQIGAIYEAQGDEKRAVRWYGEAFSLEPRLAFVEYNPSVIENGLVEEAMLVGYRAEAARPLVRNIYEERSRIQDLMLAAPAEVEEALAAEETEDPDELAEEVVEEQAAAESPETLDAGSLENREINQAAPPGRSPERRTFGRSSTSTSRRTFQRPDGRTVERPQPGTTGTPGTVIVQPGFVPQGGTAQPAQPNQPNQPRVITPPGSQPRFRRGVESVGRMELQLLPEPTEQPG